jgi:hypothetical protein
MCPHTALKRAEHEHTRYIYVSIYMCYIYVSSYSAEYMCPHTALKRAEHEHTRAAAAGKSSGVGSRMVSAGA